MIDVSIVIVGTNERKFVEKCLISIRASQTKYDLETLLVDNASSDGTYEMVKRDFPEVRLIRNEEKLGYIHNNVMASRQTTGRYILLLQR